MNKTSQLSLVVTSIVTVNKVNKMLKRCELIAPPWTRTPIFVSKVNNKQNVEKTSVEHLITPTSCYKAFVGMDDHEETKEEIFVDDLKESVCQKVKIQENNNPKQLI